MVRMGCETHTLPSASYGNISFDLACLTLIQEFRKLPW
jgi:hypothetical protein